jgi:fumarylacetoacetate (FAA) hydrolase
MKSRIQGSHERLYFNTVKFKRSIILYCLFFANNKNEKILYKINLPCAFNNYILMKLVSYLKEDHAQLAFLVDGILYDSDRLHPDLPVSMTMFLNYWEDIFPIAHMINLSLVEGNRKFKGISMDDVELLAPVPNPVSCRDTFTFSDGIDPQKEYEKFPEFYFKNHNSIQGTGEIICMPDHLNRLDFELEIAIVICKPGKNIKAAEADEYIGGFMIMNGITSRGLKKEEMNLTAKGKDFSTVIGTMLVTPDELEDYIITAKENHTGNVYSLAMTCRVNGKQVSEGNVADMNWTFAEIIERCSYGVQLFPGDIIASGPVRTGCFLELNNSGKINDQGYKEQWLQVGDEIEIEIENLGRLKNIIVKDESDYSILN